MLPDHEPLAVHELALVLDQLIVDEPPEATFTGEAPIVTVGAGATVTVVLWFVEPPLPLHVSVYVAFAVTAPVACVPAVALAPDQAPLAVHVLALVVDQVSVDAPPDAIVAGDAVNETVGAGVLATVTVALRVIDPPLPQQRSVKVLVDVIGPTFKEPAVARRPDQAPDAVQRRALVAAHVRRD